MQDPSLAGDGPIAPRSAGHSPDPAKVLPLAVTVTGAKSRLGRGRAPAATGFELPQTVSSTDQWSWSPESWIAGGASRGERGGDSEKK